MFGEISVRPNCLRKSGNAAVTDFDLRAYPIDDDVDREKRSEKAQERGIDRGVKWEDRCHGEPLFWYAGLPVRGAAHPARLPPPLPVERRTAFSTLPPNFSFGQLSSASRAVRKRRSGSRSVLVRACR